jgi:hypothetical protein
MVDPETPLNGRGIPAFPAEYPSDQPRPRSAGDSGNDIMRWQREQKKARKKAKALPMRRELAKFIEPLAFIKKQP